MTFQLNEFNINWYQYLHDAKYYRASIKEKFQLSLEYGLTSDDCIRLLDIQQSMQFIDLNIEINKLVARQFYLIDLLAYKQTFQPGPNYNQHYDEYLHQFLNRIYENWPHNCPLPKIKSKINNNQQHELIKIQTNKKHEIISHVINNNYNHQIKYNTMLKQLEKEGLYQSKIYNVYNTVPTPKLIVQNLKKSKHMNQKHPYIINNDYQKMLYHILLLHQYKKELKKTLWQWYPKHAIKKLNPTFLNHLNNLMD